MPDYDIRATDLDADNPKVSIKLINEQAPSRRLVEEMMIMAGEAVALWGGELRIPLPYRGQVRMTWKTNVDFTIVLARATQGCSNYLHLGGAVRLL